MILKLGNEDILLCRPLRSQVLKSAQHGQVVNEIMFNHKKD